MTPARPEWVCAPKRSGHGSGVCLSDSEELGPSRTPTKYTVEWVPRGARLYTKT